jgi:hypothetical protein
LLSFSLATSLAVFFVGSYLPRLSNLFLGKHLKMEPMAGIEPATDGLRNRCSTTELHWLNGLKQASRLPFKEPCLSFTTEAQATKLQVERPSGAAATDDS